jgi:hypothetical protein
VPTTVVFTLVFLQILESQKLYVSLEGLFATTFTLFRKSYYMFGTEFCPMGNVLPTFHSTFTSITLHHFHGLIIFGSPDRFATGAWRRPKAQPLNKEGKSMLLL